MDGLFIEDATTIKNFRKLLMQGISLALAIVALLINFNQNSYDMAFLSLAKKLPKNRRILNQLSELGRTSENHYLDFRIAQLFYIVLTELLLLPFMVFNIVSPKEFLTISLIAIPALLFATQQRLKTKISQRQKAINSEFPVIVEVLTLSIGAGESPLSAISRISNRAQGVLAEEFRKVVKETSQGKPLIAALDEFSKRVNSAQVRRFVDGLIIAMSRGTPLIQTLSSQALEARSQERNLLLRSAGKSEVSMMIPVVFLILPVSILFALYPSLTSLNLFGYQQ